MSRTAYIKMLLVSVILELSGVREHGSKHMGYGVAHWHCLSGSINHVNEKRRGRGRGFFAYMTDMSDLCIISSRPDFSASYLFPFLSQASLK